MVNQEVTLATAPSSNPLLEDSGKFGASSASDADEKNRDDAIRQCSVGESSRIILFVRRDSQPAAAIELDWAPKLALLKSN